MIKLENITKVFYTDEIQTKALDSVNLEVGRQEFVSIMGPSGCGKSTLLNIIGLLDEPSGGSLSIDNVPTAGMDDRQLSRLRNEKIGFIFQSFHLIPSMNMIDNVALPMLYRKDTPGRHAIKEQAEEMLRKVGLEHRIKHFPSQLSGGQCQRAAIARALMGAPEVLLADEPTGNLDPATADNVFAELIKIVRETGLAALIATHNPELAAQMDRRVSVRNGLLVEE